MVQWISHTHTQIFNQTFRLMQCYIRVFIRAHINRNLRIHLLWSIQFYWPTKLLLVCHFDSIWMLNHLKNWMAENTHTDAADSGIVYLLLFGQLCCVVRQLPVNKWFMCPLISYRQTYAAHSCIVVKMVAAQSEGTLFPDFLLPQLPSLYGKQQRFIYKYACEAWFFVGTNRNDNWDVALVWLTTDNGDGPNWVDKHYRYECPLLLLSDWQAVKASECTRTLLSDNTKGSTCWHLHRATAQQKPTSSRFFPELTAW